MIGFLTIFVKNRAIFGQKSVKNLSIFENRSKIGQILADFWPGFGQDLGLSGPGPGLGEDPPPSGNQFLGGV